MNGLLELIYRWTCPTCQHVNEEWKLHEPSLYCIYCDSEFDEPVIDET